VNLRRTILLTTINAKWIHPSRALRLLKANLGPLEDQAEITEFALRQSLPEKAEPLLAAHPRILGISVSIWNHTATVELLRALTAVWDAGTVPKPVIILGGPEVSHLPMEGELAGYADWVVRGEGEAVFRELCAFLLERDESGVPAEKAGETAESGRIRNGGPIASSSSSSEKIAALPSVKAVSGKLIEARPVDLAAIDSGYRLYTEEDLSRKLVYVEASRGCPFGCEFCLSSLDRQVREFPLDDFLGDMAALLDRGARSFKFLDRTFNLDIARARTIMEFFLERIGADSPPGVGPTAAATPTGNTRPPRYVHFEMVPARFPPELRETLTRFPPGSLRLEVGIQTFNRSTAALIGRPGNPDQELETLEFLWRSTNAIVHVDLIAALPGEDLDSFGAGFDRLWQARPAAQTNSEIQLGILKLLPGTPIARHSERYGMRYAPDPPYEARETAALSASSLDRVKNFARFWELIVNRGAFPDLTPALFPAGQPVFRRFMAMADWLLARFGRNWGIDRRDLRVALEEYYSSFS
jgi:radical SAM superfamily enzyme YgiQ (UPF0313 family)